MIDVSIIIVNWNVRELLRKSILSIYKYKNSLEVEIIVVDNASKDYSVDTIRYEFPKVKIIANSRNLGFARANNQGLKIAQGKYFLILNPDTELKPETLSRLYNFMEEHPEAAMVAPKLLNTDGSLQPSCRQFPTLRDNIRRKLFMGGAEKSFEHDKLTEVDQPMGAAMLVRRELPCQVGLMDEHNFIWFDEVDWCYQIKKAGEKIFFYPGAEIIHHQGKSFRKWKNPFSGIIWLKSRHYFLKKNYGIALARKFLLVDIMFFALYGAALGLLILGGLMWLGKALI